MLSLLKARTYRGVFIFQSNTIGPHTERWVLSYGYYASLTDFLETLPLIALNLGTNGTLIQLAPARREIKALTQFPSSKITAVHIADRVRAAGTIKVKCRMIVVHFFFCETVK